jgi:hypothetical protein
VGRRRVIYAIVLGLGTRTALILGEPGPIDRLWWWGLLVAYVLLLLTVYSMVCWPLTTYRGVAQVTALERISNNSLGLAWTLVSDTADETLLWVLSVTAGGTILSLAFVYGVMTLVVFARRRLWPVYRNGYCRRCGYDLRGLTEERCPECGTAFRRQESPSGPTD